jgi:hypothetical protein
MVYGMQGGNTRTAKKEMLTPKGEHFVIPLFYQG